ncbi:MAG: hypothetical protein JXA20_19125 [Spirochaetes bacterium]|nr:hypothetical protein [Spirochaetota bacterium]
MTSRKSTAMPPVALILAGYDKVSRAKRKEKKEEIRQAYDGDEIFIGQNKFLRDLNGKPVIQYVIDAVYNTRKRGRRLYDRIYVYNDVESFLRVIDVSRYDNLTVVQMRESVGGHWKDFYFNHIEYGQRVDVFFGDTPRITPEDILYVHDEFNAVLDRGRDHRGNRVSLVYGIVEYEDMKDDNWLPHRIKFIKRGKNAGKLKSFVGFKGFQARVGNMGTFEKNRVLDPLIDHEAANFVYNLRKALTPRVFSRILYHIWKSKKFDTIRQIKNRCIIEGDIIDTLLSVLTYLHRDDYSKLGGVFQHIKKNAARWENDIDGPLDMEAFRHHFRAMHHAAGKKRSS